MNLSNLGNYDLVVNLINTNVAEGFLVQASLTLFTPGANGPQSATVEKKVTAFSSGKTPLLAQDAAIAKVVELVGKSKAVLGGNL